MNQHTQRKSIVIWVDWLARPLYPLLNNTGPATLQMTPGTLSFPLLYFSNWKLQKSFISFPNCPIKSFKCENNQVQKPLTSTRIRSNKLWGKKQDKMSSYVLMLMLIVICLHNPKHPTCDLVNRLCLQYQSTVLVSSCGVWCVSVIFHMCLCVI